MIRFTTSGSTKNTQAWLARLKSGDQFSDLERYGQMGVDALSNATPVETGATAAAWRYRVYRKGGKYSIAWYNTNKPNGTFDAAIALQFGHGTGTGGWVPGRDYINPAVRPIFDQIEADIMRKVRY